MRVVSSPEGRKGPVAILTHGSLNEFDIIRIAPRYDTAFLIVMNLPVESVFEGELENKEGCI